MQNNRNSRHKIAYSIKEACEASSLGRTTLYRQIRTNRLKMVRVGGRSIIPADSLHALVGANYHSDSEPGGNQ